MPADEHDSDQCNGTHRQPDQRREHDHRDAERPDHLHHETVLVAQVEGPREGHDGELEHDEPQPAREQKATQLGRGAALRDEARAHAGQQHEDRRAEVRDPPREEERRVGLREIERAESCGGEVVADVIERHQDDHESPQQVDRGDAGACAHALCSSHRPRHRAAENRPGSRRRLRFQSGSHRFPVLIQRGPGHRRPGRGGLAVRRSASGPRWGKHRAKSAEPATTAVRRLVGWRH